jgi:predicted  nucleic acid-binding Zn-ribbon protein
VIGMSKTKNLDELRATRIELEDESHFLEETKKSMEIRVNILEEKIAITELENSNEAARKSIAQLKSEVKTLENRLNQTPRE